MSLKGKKILLGISGGIAAYKSAELVRLLIRAGADVRVVMTPAARDFVGPLTFSALSKNPVPSELFDPNDGTWTNHVELGLWADLCVIAPATANTLAALAHGQSNNLLLTTALSVRCPMLLAPAMDEDMWNYPATRNNIALLRGYGHNIAEPGTGELASGLTGTGRMAEPSDLFRLISSLLQTEKQGPLYGKKILITAGPTHEAIDPVRYIGNHSSGKMGFALAEECALLGAEVTLVHGPVQIKSAHPGITAIPVTSAEEMFEACSERFSQCAIFIAAAAVADFTPVNVAGNKIKKSGTQSEGLNLELKKTMDILGTLSAKKSQQYVVGFALETENAQENAQKKLREKKLDLCVLNVQGEKGAGFGTDTNRVTLLDKSGDIINFELKSKQETARDIISHIIQHLHAS